jgi:hypothetical protein
MVLECLVSRLRTLGLVAYPYKIAPSAFVRKKKRVFVILTPHTEANSAETATTYFGSTQKDNFEYLGVYLNISEYISVSQHNYHSRKSLVLLIELTFSILVIHDLRRY